MGKAKSTSRRRRKSNFKFPANKKTLSLMLGICLTVLASAYVANARFSADSVSGIPTSPCVNGTKTTLMPTYSIKVVDAGQRGIPNKKIIVRAPLFLFSSEKNGWVDPSESNEYVASIDTVVTDSSGMAVVKIPYCVIGSGNSSKYYLGKDDKIFRSINFYLENVNLPAQNVSDFFSGKGSNLSEFNKINSKTMSEPITFTVYSK